MMLPIAADVIIVWSFHLTACLSVKLMHSESRLVLDRGLALHGAHWKNGYCGQPSIPLGSLLFSVMIRDQLNSRFHGRDIFREIDLFP